MQEFENEDPKRAYFRLMRDMDDEPDEEDIPISFHELPLVVRLSIDIHNKLPDITEMTDAGMMVKGKELSLIKFYFDCNKIPEDAYLVISKIIDILDLRYRNECAKRFNQQVKDFNRKMRSR